MMSESGDRRLLGDWDPWEGAGTGKPQGNHKGRGNVHLQYRKRIWHLILDGNCTLNLMTALQDGDVNKNNLMLQNY